LLIQQQIYSKIPSRGVLPSSNSDLPAAGTCLRKRRIIYKFGEISDDIRRAQHLPLKTRHSKLRAMPEAAPAFLGKIWCE
jgi:hypothetical protein